MIGFMIMLSLCGMGASFFAGAGLAVKYSGAREALEMLMKEKAERSRGC